MREKPCLFGRTQIAWQLAVELDVMSKVMTAVARGACEVQKECQKLLEDGASWSITDADGSKVIWSCKCVSVCAQLVELSSVDCLGPC